MYGSYKTKYIGKTSGFPGFTMRPTIILSNECIGVARIFDWGNPKPQITCNDVIRNFERGIFSGGKDIVEWKIRSRGLVLARN